MTTDELKRENQRLRTELAEAQKSLEQLGRLCDQLVAELVEAARAHGLLSD